MNPMIVCFPFIEKLWKQFNTREFAKIENDLSLKVTCLDGIWLFRWVTSQEELLLRRAIVTDVSKTSAEVIFQFKLHVIPNTISILLPQWL